MAREGATSYRLSGDALDLIERLAARHAASKARVIEMAVRALAKEEGMAKRMRLSLDYDGVSRGYDEEFEYLTRSEREQLIADYVHHHADVIEELAGKPFHEIEDTERFVDVTEWSDD